MVLPAVAALHPYEPGKPIEEVQRELGIGEPVKLASNENPVGPSPLAVAAIRAGAQRAQSLSRRRRAGRCATRSRPGIRSAPSRFSWARGSCEILNLLVYLFLAAGPERGDRGASFVIYQLAIAASGGAAKVVPLREDYVFDLDAMAGAIDDNTRLVFLGNPNNPTGTIYRRAEWQRFLSRVPERVVIVADEAYFEFVRDPEYPGFDAGSRRRAHAGDAADVSRRFSAWRGCAWVTRWRARRSSRLLNNVRQPFNVTSLAQVAVLAGMDDDEHVRRTLEINAAGMAYLESEFRRLELAVRSRARRISSWPRSATGARYTSKLAATGRDRAADERLRAAAPRADQRGTAEENHRLVAALERVRGAKLA